MHTSQIFLSQSIFEPQNIRIFNLDFDRILQLPCTIGLTVYIKVNLNQKLSVKTRKKLLF